MTTNACVLFLIAALPGLPPSGVTFDEILGSYRALSRYEDHGRLIVTTRAGGEEVERSWPMRIALERPNRLRLDAGQVLLVSDGERLLTVNRATRSYALAKAPPALALADITEGSAGALLLGGPASRPAGLVMALLLGTEPVEGIVSDGTKVEPEPEAELHGRACSRLRIDQPSGPDLRLWIDAETRLARRIELLGDSPEAGRTTIAWESGDLSTGPVPAETFATAAPPGMKRVEPLKADP